MYIYVTCIRNKNNQEKLKRTKYKYISTIFDGPLQIQKYRILFLKRTIKKDRNICTFHLFYFIFLGDFYFLLSVRCYCT